MTFPRTAALLTHLPEPFELRWERRELHFRTPARTSRGALSTREIYYVHARSVSSTGTGECAPVPGLSPECRAHLPELLEAACHRTVQQQGLSTTDFADTPAIRLALEGALLGLLEQQCPLRHPDFESGSMGLEIHHLIWMNSTAAMCEKIREGLEQGFRCIKLKVGALPFEDELPMLRDIHREFPAAEIRVDANGAFSPQEAPARLEALAAAGVSLIEQPIAPGQWKQMAALLRGATLDIALDEELTPLTRPEQKAQMMNELQPAALIIKPTLHGGLSGAEEWASLAEAHGTRWLINSAMESSTGHELLADWCSRHAPQTIHGLSTGNLYTDNHSERLRLIGSKLFRRK